MNQHIRLAFFAFAISLLTLCKINFAFAAEPILWFPLDELEDVYCDCACHEDRPCGTDFAISEGTSIYAPISGTVTYVRENITVQDEDLEYGNYVTIESGDYKVYLGHMLEYSIEVEQDQYVNAGDFIGLSSNTGYTLPIGGGYHLHLELRVNGTAEDPEDYWATNPPQKANGSGSSSRESIIATEFNSSFSTYNQRNKRTNACTGSKESPGFMLNSSSGDLHWWGYSTDSDPNQSSHTRDTGKYTTVLVENYTGSCSGAIVYDEWGGANRAYTVQCEQWDRWLSRNGPQGNSGSTPQHCGNPITNVYGKGNKWVQDFQDCIITYNPDDGCGDAERKQVKSYPNEFAPGELANGTWSTDISYLFAERYESGGASKRFGYPNMGVTLSASGKYYQNFPSRNRTFYYNGTEIKIVSTSHFNSHLAGTLSDSELATYSVTEEAAIDAENLNETDSDADGFSIAEGDCADANASLHPAEVEIDDGIDNDCNGATDDLEDRELTSTDSATWLDIDGITDNQYLFIDVNQDGYADPCVRQSQYLYCDQDMDGQHDWTFEYGTGGNEEYFSNGTGVTVNFGDDMWYSDTTGDGVSESSVSYGDGFSETSREVHGGAIMVRWSDDIYIDDDMDGVTDRHITWPNTNAYPLYLADMNGDGTQDVICRVGNIFYVEDNSDGSTDWWFTYGTSTDEHVYFADLSGDGKDDILIQRGLVDYNWFLVLDNTSILTSASNTNTSDFTYGHGLLETDLIEDQYLFFDANGDGMDDACVRRYTTTILCDTNGDADGDVSFDIGSSGGSAWYAGGSSVCVRYNDTFYCDQTADGTTDTVFAIGNGGNDDYQFNDDAAAVRYSSSYYVDTDLDGWTNFSTGWPGTSAYPYYLADMNGDGTPDMIRRDGNIFYVNTNGDIYTDWWFTYGASDGSDDYYFADLDGDGYDDVMVLRENENSIRNWLLVKYNSSIQLSGASNSNDDDFTYGWGL